MNKIVMSGTGLFTPKQSISNHELVESFNQFVKQYNETHAAAIEKGELRPLKESNEEFIVKASGIKNRYVMDKVGILDTEVMQPLIPKRENEELSLQAEMCVIAAKQALNDANLNVADIDLVIVACSNLQRAYPAIAIEVQHALGINGFAYDMNVACSSATFAIQAAYSAVKSGIAKRVLIANPEICSAHLNFRDRDSHFIFGDACTAMVIESSESVKTESVFSIVATETKTIYSNNIRNNFGFLTKTDPGVFASPEKIYAKENMFVQQGRKVFKDIVPMVSTLIKKQLEENNIPTDQLKRLWLHQANTNINRLVAEKVLGFTPDKNVAPTILDEYANTSSPGCVIAFHKYHDDLAKGDYGVLCSFGAGYSIGSIILQRA